MASITIRNLDDGLKRRLRVRAAENGRSMEEEAREILRRTVGEGTPPKDLGRAIHARFAALDGVELELPERGPMRPPHPDPGRTPVSPAPKTVSPAGGNA